MRHRRNADVESQQGVTNIELNTAHRGSIVSPEQLRPPQHGDFHLPEHPTDESIGQDSKINDSLERIVGPNVGDFSGACADDDNVVMTDTLIRWIDGVANHSSLTLFQLYVNLHHDFIHVGTDLSSCDVKLIPEVQSSLALPDPTHCITAMCDCVAPRARLDLYLQASRHVGSDLVHPPLESQWSHGWRIASTIIETGYGVMVRLPLVLDNAWNAADPKRLSIVLEALDEDELKLPQRNAIVTTWDIIGSGSYQARTLAQYAHLGSTRLQLHELFGLSPLTKKDEPTVRSNNNQPGDHATADRPHEPLVFNPALMENAAKLAETDREDGPECPICMSNPAMTVLFPCTHSLCFECAVHLRDSVQKSRQHDRRNGREPRRQYVCHICRCDIESMCSLSRQETPASTV